MPAPDPAVPRTDGRAPAPVSELATVTELVELLDAVWESARRSTSTTSISTAQLRLMHLVDRQPGIRMRTLSQLLGAAAPSVTRLCDRLEAAGYLARHPSPHSGRELTLRLTAAGAARLAQIRRHRGRRLSRVLDTMSVEQRIALTAALAALCQGIADTADTP
ncbi:MarR family winged helix-turn-helix transcriptional regulator [Streptomyces subrutilus]|uniref:MarR family winged helix-turn-helix transcriptional regulator n=1 Tax=Streptomyces subrutilus TaxID=36818 RepID=UPI0033C0F4AB